MNTHEECPLGGKVHLWFNTHWDHNALARWCVPFARQCTIVSVLVACGAGLRCMDFDLVVSTFDLT
jgi:hypothetical protein